jgi:hypothetical protein
LKTKFENSQRVVNQLAQFPQYFAKSDDGEIQAVRISDGAVVGVPSSNEDLEDGMLSISWPGSAKPEYIDAQKLMNFEVVVAVDQWLAHGEMQGKRDALIADQKDHFGRKFGF